MLIRYGIGARAVTCLGRRGLWPVPQVWNAYRRGCLVGQPVRSETEMDDHATSVVDLSCRYSVVPRSCSSPTAMYCGERLRFGFLAQVLVFRPCILTRR